MNKTRYFILVGDKDTWIESLSHDIWGFSERTKGNWKTSSIDDYVVFYVTSPTKRIIGYGSITRKFIGEDIVFPDEITFGKPVWKYRIGFKKLFLLKNWNNGVLISQKIMLNTGRKVVDKRFFLEIKSALIRKSSEI